MYANAPAGPVHSSVAPVVVILPDAHPVGAGHAVIHGNVVKTIVTELGLVLPGTVLQIVATCHSYIVPQARLVNVT